MAAPQGNQNARKGREWADSVRKAIKQYQDDSVKRGQAMEKIAYKLIEKALEGDMMALKEIGDRLDGKPAQEIAAEIEHTYVMELPNPNQSVSEWEQQQNHRLQ